MKIEVSKFIKIFMTALAGALEDGQLTLEDLPEFISTLVKEGLKEEK